MILFQDTVVAQLLVPPSNAAGPSNAGRSSIHLETTIFLIELILATASSSTPAGKLLFLRTFLSDQFPSDAASPLTLNEGSSTTHSAGKSSCSIFMALPVSLDA